MGFLILRRTVISKTCTKTTYQNIFSIYEKTKFRTSLDLGYVFISFLSLEYLRKKVKNSRNVYWFLFKICLGKIQTIRYRKMFHL